MKCDISAIVADARQRRATQLFTGGPDAHTLGLADAVVPHEYIAVTIRVVWDQIRRVGRERHESPVCAQDRFKAFAICLIAALSTLARTIHLQPEVTSISDSANTKPVEWPWSPLSPTTRPSRPDAIWSTTRSARSLLRAHSARTERTPPAVRAAQNAVAPNGRSVRARATRRMRRTSLPGSRLRR